MNFFNYFPRMLFLVLFRCLEGDGEGFALLEDGVGARGTQNDLCLGRLFVFHHYSSLFTHKLS